MVPRACRPAGDNITSTDRDRWTSTRGQGVIVSAPFDIHESAHDGVVRLVLSGEVDLAAIPAIRDEVGRHLRVDSVTHIVVDLSAVTFLDSSGIGILVGCQRQATEAGKIYQVVNAHGRVADVLELTGVMKLLAGPPSAATPFPAAEPSGADNS
jgi:anti-anti-sigma factor